MVGVNKVCASTSVQSFSTNMELACFTKSVQAFSTNMEIDDGIGLLHVLYKNLFNFFLRFLLNFLNLKCFTVLFSQFYAYHD